MASTGTFYDYDPVAAPKAPLAIKKLPTTYGGAASAGYPLGLRSDGYVDPSWHPPLGILGGRFQPAPHFLNPPNNNFEDGLTGWTTSKTGTGTAAVIDATAANKLTGLNSAKLQTAAAADTSVIIGPMFPAGAGIPLSVFARLKSSGSAGRVTVSIAWFTNASTANGSAMLCQVTGIPTVYAEYGAVVVPPPGTSYAQVTVTLDTAADTLWVDEEIAQRETAYDFDLRRFGAYGDNATDDTAALQRALAFLARAGGGTLCVRAAHYLNPSAALALAIPKNVELRFGPLGTFKAGANLSLTLACKVTAGMWRIFDITGAGTIIMSSAGVREALAEWWGCVADGATDNTAAMMAFIAGAVAQGVRGLLAKGNYYCASSMIWNFLAVYSTGPRLEGSGIHATSITLAKGATLIITAHNGNYTYDSNSNLTNSQASFYYNFKGFAVNGNVDGSSSVNGAVMHIGRPPIANADGSDKVNNVGNPQFPDQINDSEFDISVANASISQYAISLQCSGHYGNTGIFQANGGGSPGFANPSAGTAVRMRQVQFCTYTLNLGSANLGVFLDFYCVGNVFPTCDIEEVNATVRFYTAGASLETSVRNNKFLGGQFSWYGSSNPLCIADACGDNNVFDGCNIAPRANTNNQTWVTGNDARRVVIRNAENNNLSPPSPPASGTWYANPFNRRAYVSAFASGSGNAISASYVAPVDATGLTGGTPSGIGLSAVALANGGTITQRVVAAGEFISVYYSGTISWVWEDAS